MVRDTDLPAGVLGPPDALFRNLFNRFHVTDYSGYMARQARVMRSSPDGHTYSFDAGTFSLELLLTGGPGMYARWELLHAPEDLVAWLGGSMLGVKFVRAGDQRQRVRTDKGVPKRTARDHPEDPGRQDG